MNSRDENSRTDPTANGTRISAAVIAKIREEDWFKALPDRVLDHLTELGESYAEASGFGRVTRLVHSLETAILADSLTRGP